MRTRRAGTAAVPVPGTKPPPKCDVPAAAGFVAPGGPTAQGNTRRFLLSGEVWGLMRVGQSLAKRTQSLAQPGLGASRWP